MFEAFALNIMMYSALPLYFLTLSYRTCIASFYGYIGIVLFIGGLATSIYSFPLSESLVISGGNIAYGAFMMSTVMLIIIQNDINTFKNMIRLVVTVDVFVFFGLSFISWLLSSGLVIDSYNLPPSIFDVSFTVLLIGGFLILGEIILLLYIFLQVKKHLSNLFLIASIYTLSFIAILCLDGVLFPFIAFLFGIIPLTSDIVIGNVMGKFITAVCYSFPLIAFYLMYQKSLERFIATPRKIRDLLGVSRSELLETLQRYEVRDVQLQADKQELTKIADHDQLTSLPNRRKFDTTFEKEWDKCKDSVHPLTLVIGDIDFFKQYNDTYGHNQGDECLREVGLLWREVFNSPLVLPARIGGEEFAVIIPNASVKDVLPMLRKFLKSLHGRKISHEKSSTSDYVTMSIGVASIVPNNKNSRNELFNTTDKCLYSAKNNGRNQIFNSILL